MKKFFSVFLVSALFLFFSGIGKASELYSQKLTVVKNSKKAKEKIVKGKIKATNKEIKRILENPNISDKEKNRQLDIKQRKLTSLYSEKTRIKEQYKKDKANLKLKYN